MSQEILNPEFINELKFVLSKIEKNIPNLSYDDLEQLKKFMYIKEYHI